MGNAPFEILDSALNVSLIYKNKGKYITHKILHKLMIVFLQKTSHGFLENNLFTEIIYFPCIFLINTSGCFIDLPR